VLALTIMQWLIAPFVYARKAVLATFVPKEIASSAEIRRNGLVTLGAGIALFVAAGILLVMATTFEFPTAVVKVMLAPLIVAYVLLIVGGHRTLTGREPATEQTTVVASLRRIAIGTVAVILSVGLLLAALLLGLWALGV
jgi:hypothetical protein